MRTLPYILFVFGGFICLTNFYLSFIRHPLYKLIHKRYKWVSGIPVVGSISVALSLIFLYRTTWVLITGLFLIAIDTVGLLWFLGAYFYYEVPEKKPANSESNKKEDETSC